MKKRRIPDPGFGLPSLHNLLFKLSFSNTCIRLSVRLYKTVSSFRHVKIYLSISYFPLCYPPLFWFQIYFFCLGFKLLRSSAAGCVGRVCWPAGTDNLPLLGQNYALLPPDSRACQLQNNIVPWSRCCRISAGCCKQVQIMILF